MAQSEGTGEHMRSTDDERRAMAKRWRRDGEAMAKRWLPVARTFLMSLRDAYSSYTVKPRR